MSLMDGLNEMMIQELVSGALGHIEDKEMVKEKADEFLNYLDKIDDKMLVILSRINGKVSILIGKKDDIEFNKKPSFINIEDILRSAADGL